MEYSIQIRIKMFQIFHLDSYVPECPTNRCNWQEGEDLNVFQILSDSDALPLVGAFRPTKRVPPDTLTEELKK
jgi:hypothetical protein